MFEICFGEKRSDCSTIKYTVPDRKWILNSNGKSNEMRKVNILIQRHDAICGSSCFVALFLCSLVHFMKCKTELSLHKYLHYGNDGAQILCTLFISDSLVFFSHWILNSLFFLSCYFESTNCTTELLFGFLDAFFYPSHSIWFWMHFRFPIRIPLS